MLKLFASDVDGTLLLAPDKILTDTVRRDLLTVANAGVAVAIVSGRDAVNLEKLFSFAGDKFYLVSCFGAVCRKGGKTLFRRPVADSAVLKAWKTENGVIFCGEETLYVRGDGELTEKLTHVYGERAKTLKSVSEIKENIYKLSFVGDGENDGFGETIPFELRLSYRRHGWTEYVNRFADKGVALDDLKARLNVAMQNVASAGDEPTDGGMLARSAYRYALKRETAEEARAVYVSSPDELMTAVKALCG